MAGTALNSGLELPALTKEAGAGENGISECQMAETSFRRVLMICGSAATTCRPECAASWNSAIRDARAAVGSGCRTLEALVNNTYLFSVSVTPPFTLQEWRTLQFRCRQRCGTFNGLVGLVSPCDIATTYHLAPPESVCPSFKVTNGVYQYRVLTWETMKYYQQQNLGCLGGLSVLGGGEHSSWACVHEESCPALVQADDLACYKYSHMRGEFHFWDLNSALGLVPPLFRVDASFCFVNGDYALRNARNGSVIDILKAEYKMTRYHENNATLDMVQGMVRDLGNWGCGKFQVRKNAKYWLELSADGFYSWSGWFYTHDEEVVVSRSLYPILDDACGIGISLDWCAQAPRSMEMYLFRPGAGEEVQSGSEYMLHWENRTFEPSAGDLVRLEFRETRRQGPTTFYMVGTLPIGSYGIVVHTPNPNTRLSGNCATVSLTAGATDNGHVTSVTVGDKGVKGSWWYALNVHVELQSSQAILFSYSIVDQIINPGPAWQSGALQGSFPVPLAMIPAQEKQEMFSLLRSRRECGIFGVLGVNVFDARTGQQLDFASYTLDDEPTVYQVDSLQVSHDGQGNYVGGLSYFEGEHAAIVSRAGYVPRTTMVTIFKGNVPSYAEVYLVPMDNLTHFVFNWGNAPADLDLVVVPKGVADFARSAVYWNGPGNTPIPSIGECEEPYLWNGVNPAANNSECSCVITGPETCDPVCFIQATLAGPYTPRISLDREERQHGGLGSNGFVTNKPETLTFERLMPGTYEVYAYAQESGSMEGELTLDVYLGDGMDFMSFATGEVYRASGESWVHFGSLLVFPTSRGCEGATSESQTPQDGMVTILCYSWQSALQAVSYPLRALDRLGLVVRDATQESSEVPRAMVAIDGFNFFADATPLVSLLSGLLTGGHLIFPESRVSVSAPNYVQTNVRIAHLTCRPDPVNMAVFMVPGDGKTRVVLKWGDVPMNLDVYVLPRGVTDLEGSFASWLTVAGGQPQTWNANEDPYAWYQERVLMSTSGQFSARVSLDRNDAIHGTRDALLGQAVNGPETVTFEQLLPGSYEVYVNANPPDESRGARNATQVFGSRFDVEVYLGDGVSSTRQVDTAVVSAAGAIWRYIGQIRVYLRTENGCRGVSRMQSPIGGVQFCYEWVRFNSQTAYPLEGVGIIKALVLSVVPSAPLGRVEMTIAGQARPFFSSEFSLSSQGIFIPQGARSVTVRAEGFSSSTKTAIVGSYTIGPTILVFFLVPISDGKTRAILRWGDTPADLDIYVVPRRTVQLDGSRLTWTNGFPGGMSTWNAGEDSYAWWNESYIEGVVAGDYVPSVTLDRDDTTHGEVDEETGQVLNGPETMTFDLLLPGDYEVYVNAYPPDGEREEGQLFDGQIDLDIYLGNGVDSSILRETVSWTATGDIWRIAGVLSVYYTLSGSQPCLGVSREQQVTAGGNRVCYEWKTINANVDYPLGSPPVIRVRVVDAVTDQEVPGATFQVDGDVTAAYTAEQMDVGLSVIPGEHTVMAFAPGYLSKSYVVEASTSVGYTLYLVPDDGYTRVVVNWGALPANLDTYVVPSEVITCDNVTAEWVAEDYFVPQTVGEGEGPYVWHREPTLIVNDGRNLTEYEYYTYYYYEEENTTYYYYYGENATDGNATDGNATYYYYYEYEYNVTNVTYSSGTRRLLNANLTNSSSNGTLSNATLGNSTIMTTPVPAPLPICSNSAFDQPAAGGLTSSNSSNSSGLSNSSNFSNSSNSNTTDDAPTLSDRFFPMISLIRDEASHSMDLDSDGFLLNGPEIVTFRDLLPGLYLVYVNAKPPDGSRDAGQVFTGPVSVDVYLGDGVNSTLLVSIVEFEDDGSIWRHIGWIEVGSLGSECEGATSVRQLRTGSGLGFCYSWYPR